MPALLPLPHTAVIHQHTANQNGHTASIQPIRESNGSDGRQPTFSDYASWMGGDTLRYPFLKLPKQLNTLNRFVPKLVRVSSNASDGQWLTRCVSGYTVNGWTFFPTTQFHPWWHQFVSVQDWDVEAQPWPLIDRRKLFSRRQNRWWHSR